MPKSLFQEIIFTLMMVLFMVYGMSCYNISTAMGGLTNKVFLMALKNMIIMVPVAFVIEMFIVGPIVKKITFKILNPQEDKPFFITLMISACTIWMMCPLMSFVATLIFNGGFSSEFFSMWIQKIFMNYPMAILLQFFVAGPIVRKIFSLIFRNK